MATGSTCAPCLDLELRRPAVARLGIALRECASIPATGEILIADLSLANLDLTDFLF
jgi:hypothetical protein